MTNLVNLTAREMELAALVGCKRRIRAIFRGQRDLYGALPDDRWDRDIEGALAECAYAKWSGRYWSDQDLGEADGDVGRVQVRTTSHPNGCLLLHPQPQDKPDSPYVLLTGQAPRFVVRGWCWGREGMLQQYWRDPKGGRPCFFVPQTALKPMVKQ